MVQSNFLQLQDKIDAIVTSYIENNPQFIAVAKDKDPSLAGKSDADISEELKVYPGVIAVAVNKVAHALYKSGTAFAKIEARRLSEAAHTRSGIDIHPGTSIGENCFIDHGTGVVIGETARVGKNTLLYHDVTLGAYGTPSSPQHRHPEIGDDCTVSVGAKVLGNVKIHNNVTVGPDALLFGNHLVVGDNVSIGAGAQIGGSNVIADNVKVGPGAIIPKGIGAIDRDVPPYSSVGRNEGGDLYFAHAVNISAEKSFTAALQPTSSAQSFI